MSRFGLSGERAAMYPHLRVALCTLRVTIQMRKRKRPPHPLPRPKLGVREAHLMVLGLSPG